MATERKNTEARIHPSKDVAREMSWQEAEEWQRGAKVEADPEEGNARSVGMPQPKREPSPLRRE